MPRITFAFEQEDGIFAEYRGKGYHGGVSGANPSSSSSSSKKQQLKLNLTSNSTNAGKPPSGSGYQIASSPGGGVSGVSSVGGGILTKSILRGNSPAGPVTTSGNKSSSPVLSPQVNPFTFRANSVPTNHPSPNSSHPKMAGLGLNGGSISGSLLTLGHHGAHTHGGGGNSGNLVVDATSFKDCAHPSLNETLKSHNALSFKVIRVGKYNIQLVLKFKTHSLMALLASLP